MPIANSLIVNQKLVFARIEIAAAREIYTSGLLQDNPIENKLHQHAHLDSAVNQLAKAFDYFLLELAEESTESGRDRDLLRKGLLKNSPWLATLLVARDSPEFIALQFASDNSPAIVENASSNLIASVTLAEVPMKNPIDLLSDWNRQLQAIVDQHRASLFEE